MIPFLDGPATMNTWVDNMLSVGTMRAWIWETRTMPNFPDADELTVWIWKCFDGFRDTFGWELSEDYAKAACEKAMGLR